MENDDTCSFKIFGFEKNETLCKSNNFIEIRVCLPAAYICLACKLIYIYYDLQAVFVINHFNVNASCL